MRRLNTRRLRLINYFRDIINERHAKINLPYSFLIVRVRTYYGLKTKMADNASLDYETSVQLLHGKTDITGVAYSLR